VSQEWSMWSCRTCSVTFGTRDDIIFEVSDLSVYIRLDDIIFEVSDLSVYIRLV
jgi:hypothetical protein